jgi:hypothetical protein
LTIEERWMKEVVEREVEIFFLGESQSEVEEMME